MPSTLPLKETSATDADWSPRCDKCNAEITTGLMAVFCPLKDACALHPGPESQDSIDEFRALFCVDTTDSTGAA